jgi:aryl-alcohol dehydrogenase-like predicted oxidoreductase
VVLKTMKNPKRRLGTDGPEVGAIGYGAMGLAGYYGAADEREGVRTIQHALEIGVDLIDTADAYGEGHNERLVAQAIRGARERAVVATKVGIVFEEGEEGRELPTGWGFSLRINGRPEYLRRAIDASLERLEVETIDLLYLHYVDPGTPVEDSVGALAEAVDAGKVRFLGLSNATTDEVRRAHAVHPLAAVQYEWSLWRREAERQLLPLLDELGIGIVPWSPLGAGFLAGADIELPPRDFRRNNPKLQAENLARNTERFAPLGTVAQDLGITPAQLALAWLLHQGPDVVPIPGTRRTTRLDENAAAARVRLDQATLRRIDALVPIGAASGGTLVP